MDVIFSEEAKGPLIEQEKEKKIKKVEKELTPTRQEKMEKFARD